MSQGDQIRRKQLLDAPETVNSDWNSPSTSLDDRVGAFSLSLNYDNGSAVNMKVYFQVSTDNLNFGDITNLDGSDAGVVITDSTGVVLFDVDGSGAAFCRLRIQVTAGSIDATEVNYIALQFH